MRCSVSTPVAMTTALLLLLLQILVVTRAAADELADYLNYQQVVSNDVARAPVKRG